MTAFSMKRNDLLPALAATLKNPDGTPADLTSATAVVFNMVGESLGAAVIINRAAVVIVDASAGLVRYDWAAGDTTSAGDYRAEFEVTYSPGAKPMTYPGRGYISVHIDSDLA